MTWLRAHAEVTITIHVFITQDGGTIDNEACVDPDNEVIESNEGDNCDTKSTPVVVLSPNLSVQKSGPSSADPPARPSPTRSRCPTSAMRTRPSR